MIPPKSPPLLQALLNIDSQEEMIQLFEIRLGLCHGRRKFSSNLRRSNATSDCLHVGGWAASCEEMRVCPDEQTENLGRILTKLAHSDGSWQYCNSSRIMNLLPPHSLKWWGSIYFPCEALQSYKLQSYNLPYTHQHTAILKAGSWFELTSSYQIL